MTLNLACWACTSSTAGFIALPSISMFQLYLKDTTAQSSRKQIQREIMEIRDFLLNTLYSTKKGWMEEGLNRERLEACNANLSRSLTVHWGILVERQTVLHWTEISGVLYQSWLLTRPIEKSRTSSENLSWQPGGVSWPVLQGRFFKATSGSVAWGWIKEPP